MLEPDAYDRGFAAAEKLYLKQIEEKDKKIKKLEYIITNPSVILDERLNYMESLRKELQEAKDKIIKLEEEIEHLYEEQAGEDI